MPVVMILKLTGYNIMNKQLIMKPEILEQAETFVRNFSHSELRDIKEYLEAAGVPQELRMHPILLAVLDRIKKQHKEARQQIVERINDVLGGSRAA